MHEINVLHNTIVERRLEYRWQERRNLPVHDHVELLVLGFHHLSAASAAIVELIIPSKVVPILRNIEIQEVERRFGADRLEDVLTVGVGVANFSLGSLQQKPP